MNFAIQFALAVSIYLSFASLSYSDITPKSTEQTLVEITTDLDAHIYRVIFSIDDKGRVYQGTVDNHVTSIDKFIEDVHRGMHLSEYKGIPVVTLIGEDFHPEYGGEIRLRYLVRPVITSYRVKRFLLEKNQDQWELIFENADGNKNVVKKMHVVTKKFFGIPIGVSNIIVNP